MVLNKVEPSSQQEIHSNSNTQNQKPNIGKVGNENKLSSSNALINEANQDPIYIFDDAGNNNSNSNNNIEDDDETQVKYLYSLLKNRIPNSI